MRTDGSAVARRVYILMAALAGGGVAGAYWIWGPEGAMGFLAGVAMSFGNAYWMHRVTQSIGTDNKKPGAASTLAVFRYLLMAVILYGILNISETGFLAALAGCFVHIAAVVLEVVYELTYGTS
jgi:hypothetical protein